MLASWREISGLRRVPLLSLLLLLSCPRQDPRQRVVALVAGVFVDVIVGPAQRNFAFPRLRVRRAVLDGELVQDLLLADTREALGHFAGRRQIEALLDAVVRLLPRIEIRRLDDQRVAVPVANRIAHPRRDLA